LEAIILNCAALPLSETIISPVTPCGRANNAIAIYKQLLHRKTKLILL